MATTIIIIESVLIITLLAFFTGSKNTLISKTEYVRLNESLRALNEALNAAKKEISESNNKIKIKDIQIKLLLAAKDELYDKIHNKPKDLKGRFCRKEAATNGADN